MTTYYVKVGMGMADGSGNPMYTEFYKSSDLNACWTKALALMRIYRDVKVVDGSGTAQTMPLGDSLVDLSLYALKDEVETGYAGKARLTDGSVTKVGTATVGGSYIPVYLKAGVPTACVKMAGIDARNTFSQFQTIQGAPAKLAINSTTTAMPYITMKRSNESNAAEVLKWDGTSALTVETTSASEARAIVTKGWVTNSKGVNPILHTDGDEKKNGRLTLVGAVPYSTMLVIQHSNMHVSETPATCQESIIRFDDADGAALASIRLSLGEDGTRALKARLFKKDGTYQDKVLFSIQV